GLGSKARVRLDLHGYKHVDRGSRPLIVARRSAPMGVPSPRPLRHRGESSVEIYLEKTVIRQIRTSIEDAIEEGEYETLREDIIEAFSDDDIEEIERRIDSGDFFDFVSVILDEWSGEDAQELFELLEQQLSDAGIELKHSLDDEEEEEEEEEEDEEEEDEEL